MILHERGHIMSPDKWTHLTRLHHKDIIILVAFVSWRHTQSDTSPYAEPNHNRNIKWKNKVKQMFRLVLTGFCSHCNEYLSHVSDNQLRRWPWQPDSCCCCCCFQQKKKKTHICSVLFLNSVWGTALHPMWSPLLLQRLLQAGWGYLRLS